MSPQTDVFVGGGDLHQRPLWGCGLGRMQRIIKAGPETRGKNSLFHFSPKSQVGKRNLNAAAGHREINFRCNFRLPGSLLNVSYLTVLPDVRQGISVLW